MSSHTEENYLKALLKLADENGQINVSDLSTEMEVRMPTVNSMVKKLDAQGLVVYEKYKPLTITPAGRTRAALIIRKHRLTEMFLVKKMGFGWENIHEIAEQVEHVQSEAFFDRMDEMLGYPTVDPHGSPIPDKQGRIQELSYVPLSSCKPSQTVQLAALTNSSSDFLEFLNSRKLALGTELRILSREAYDQSMVVSYGQHPNETLSEKVSERLLVRVLE